MTWIFVLLALGLLGFIIFKSIDRETGQNLKRLAKALAAVVGIFFILAVLSYFSG